MKKQQNEKIQAIPNNLKINSRIFITSLMAIIIPLVIIISCVSAYFSLSSSEIIDFPSVSQMTYGFLSQLQWSQTFSDISDVLTAENDAAAKQKKIENIAGRLEKTGALVYIEKNGAEFYKTNSKEDIKQKAAQISSGKAGTNAYYIGENGLSVQTGVIDESDEYGIFVVNEKYTLPGIVSENENILGALRSGAIWILAIVVSVFIIAIVIISLITSKTIVGPIEQITDGANEIANGNYDYEIKYKSTNELGQLAKSFNNMRLRVKESIEEQNRADRQQKEMIAGIAHDLRTPLTSIKGYVEGLRDGIADTPEKQKRYIDTIYSSTRNTEKILDDLLAMSKLELSGTTLDRENVSVDDFIGFLSEKGKELEKEDFDCEIIDRTKTSPLLYIDTDSFARVINNIISNSVKYRRPDVKGKITFTVIEYQKTVLIEIKDNGMGVDRESLPRIFDTLYRADKARTNVKDGSGLGLSVCKRIVELHGGLIWAQSEPGSGLAILISLPLQRGE